MEILIPLLIALTIFGIATIMDRRKKSRKQSDKHAKNEGLHQRPVVRKHRGYRPSPHPARKTSSTTSGVETQTPNNTVQTDNRAEGADATPETPSLSEPKIPYDTAQLSGTPTKVSEPPNYPDSWEKDSRHYREQKEWQCEMCKLSLHQHKYYLHTHHIYGTRYNNLMALCIGCHSEQPGINHLLLKETPDYQGFITRYGKKWRMSNVSDFEGIRNKFRKYVEHESNILHYIIPFLIDNFS